MDANVFNQFREIIYNKSGIVLDDSKVSMLKARLFLRMQTLTIDSYQEYLSFICQESSGHEVVEMIDAISTNFTRFFREQHHFDLLTKLIKEWGEKGNKKIKIWSAACSSGEEPYSMAMIIEYAIDRKVDTKIFATDISNNILEQAKKGQYLGEQVKTVPKEFLKLFFEENIVNDKSFYSIKPVIKKYVEFKNFNLSKSPFNVEGKFDIIFCRNVMIYFDNITKQKLIDQFFQLLKDGGYLFVGHSESLLKTKTSMRLVQPTVYIK